MVELKVKDLIKFMSQLFILWFLYIASEWIVEWLKLPIPGNVLGMILLFGLLLTGVIKLEWIDGASSFLLKHLLFFFIPITVGMMTLGSIFLTNGISLIVILIVSSAIGMVVTGALSQLLAKKKEVS